MGRKYANPPLIEAVCEFKFTVQAKWDLTVPGILYEKVSKDFPLKEQRIIREIDTTQSPEGIQQDIRTNERILFLTNDKRIFIQIGQNLLAVNSLKPYPTWERFRPYVENALKSLADIVNVTNLQQVGLRFINRIEIPGTPIELDEYFNFRPHLGNGLPQDMSNFILGTMFPFAGGRENCKVLLTNAVPEKKENTGILLDIDYVLGKSATMQSKEILEWIDQAHLNIEKLFEGSITDRLRSIFQEIR
jgi:uncharacterized protein (TIGR04255 family)